jgi:hypothetical protein
MSQHLFYIWLAWQVRCFKCKTFGSLEEDIVKCGHRNCGKYYHKDCTKDWVRIPPKPLVCPRHHCDACRAVQNNAKLYRCFHCPVAYHESCSPEGTNFLEDIPGYMMCWKHDDDWKIEHKVRMLKRNVLVSFETVFHIFEI